MTITPQTIDTARPSYEVDAEHLIVVPGERFGMTGRKSGEMIRSMPATPPGAKAVVILPDGVDYVSLTACAAIADRVRQAGRVIVRGPDPRAVAMVEHELRRACWSWT